MANDLKWTKVDSDALTGDAAKRRDASREAQQRAKTARTAFEETLACKLFGTDKVQQVENAWQCTGKAAKGAHVMDTHEIVFSHRFGLSFASRPITAAKAKSTSSSGALKL